MSNSLPTPWPMGQSSPGYASSTVSRTFCIRKSFFILVLSLIYGVTLSQIPSSEFKDYDNYLIYAESSFLLLANYLQQGFGPALFNEPIWLLINSALGLFADPNTVVRLIIFISAFLTAWLVLSNNPKYVFPLLIILFLPNYLIHLRQGLAIAVFLLGWYSVGFYKKWFWLVLAPFIHSSFFFILSLLILNKLMQNFRSSVDIRFFGFLSVGLVIGLGLEWMASVLGARQAYVYRFTPTEISGLGFALWCGVLLVWITEGRLFLRRYSFETCVILTYLVTYWFVEVSARIFESGLILVLIAGLTLTRWRRAAFLILVLGAGGYVWLAQVDKPWLGFGVDAI